MYLSKGNKYDYLVVGAGMFGATFAEQMHAKGKRVIVLEKRNHIAGNAYTEKIEGINVHRYGPHIFHTNSKTVWDYVNRFAEFNNFINSPIANYHGEIYSLPFSMYTFNQLWGAIKPEQAKEIIRKQCEAAGIRDIHNLEEQAISLVGTDVFEKLIKGYTEKQWGCPCIELPADIIKRLPVRFTYNNNYFDTQYQGIPIGGYTSMVAKMLSGIEVVLDTDYLENKDYYNSLAETVIYTGPIDAFFSYCYGPLAYRSLSFETEVKNVVNYQGNAVINYTDSTTPFTRVIEHKHFEFGEQDKTVITYEYSRPWAVGEEPYYPINNLGNNALYEKYKELISQNKKRVLFGGRLGEYKYLDMDTVVLAALSLARELMM